jgi:hypothetical protein
MEIPLARYSYRHEAEFAAGFLDEAGVPYRLQIDDPAMGIAVGMSATLWVRGADEAHAREVLELDASGRPPPGSPMPTSREAGRGPVAAAGPTVLSGRERGLLVLGAAALAGGGLFLPEALHPILQAAPSAGAVLLALAGVLGRAPAGLRRFLRAIAGDAP